MTENTQPEGIQDEPGTAEANGHVIDEPVEVAAIPGELFTAWATSTTPENFDHDQAAVHDWMEATDEERLEALETAMTIADAEELIATAKAVAIEHNRRAERARSLVTVITARLGREAEALNASDPVTRGLASNTVEGTKPQPAPTATRKMELPSAL